MIRILLTNVLVLMIGGLARGQNADPPPGGGPGGPMGQHMELLKKFDKDGDKKLNQEERKAAGAVRRHAEASPAWHVPGVSTRAGS